MTLIRALIIAVLESLPAGAGAQQPPGLTLELRVDGALQRGGGLVVMVPRQLPAAEFRAARAGNDGAALRLTATLTRPVTFVHFDAPGADYAYDFHAASGAPLPRPEEQIGTAGAGNLYRLMPDGAVVAAELSMDHYIPGPDLTRGEALGLETSLLDFTIDPADCVTPAPGLRLCSPLADQIDRLLDRLRHSP